MELTPVASRILGCLLEKERTTPDQYPLSLNALVAACNQTTNRWPVVRYAPDTVEAGLDELREHELVRREKPHGGRAIKYSQSIGRVVPVSEPGLALLAVLLLRGPQTPGELKARCERLHEFADLDAVDRTLGELRDHEDGPLVVALPREPGRKESRWREQWSTGDESAAPNAVTEPRASDVADVTRPDDGRDLAERVARLEAEVARLTQRLDGLASDSGQ